MLKLRSKEQFVIIFRGLDVLDKKVSPVTIDVGMLHTPTYYALTSIDPTELFAVKYLVYIGMFNY